MLHDLVRSATGPPGPITPLTDDINKVDEQKFYDMVGNQVND
jgi:DNA polymerase sigma